jgi:phage terminase Nu1 subunit (DNA packaging protein)
VSTPEQLRRPVTVLSDGLLLVSDRELAAITGISRRTFQNWRIRRRGPPYTKAGRVVRYELAATIYWMRRNGRAMEAS